MWRCEEEIILKIAPSNVVDVLVKYFPSLNKDVSNENEGEEEIKIEIEELKENEDNEEQETITT